jgi:hypothetical protein
MLIYGPFTTEQEAKTQLTKLRRKRNNGFIGTRVARYGTLPTAEQEAEGMYIGDIRLTIGWGVFGEKEY